MKKAKELIQASITSDRPIRYSGYIDCHTFIEVYREATDDREDKGTTEGYSDISLWASDDKCDTLWRVEFSNIPCIEATTLNAAAAGDRLAMHSIEREWLSDREGRPEIRMPDGIKARLLRILLWVKEVVS